MTPHTQHFLYLSSPRTGEVGGAGEGSSGVVDPEEGGEGVRGDCLSRRDGDRVRRRRRVTVVSVDDDLCMM